MSLLSLPQGNRARYDITVVSHENESAGHATKRISRKGYSRIGSLGTKMGAALMALMIAGLMLLGTLGTAPSAHAGDWGPMNGLRDVMCGTAYFNAEQNDRGLGANTANPKLMDTSKTKLTGYEKYGMAGMTWTVWLGAENHGQLKGDGDVAGKQLVGMSGASGNLDNWATGDAKDYSSFYNTKAECSPMGDVGPTAVGNFLLSVTSWIVNISNLLFQTATETSSSVILTLSPTIITIVGKLKDALYLEFLAPVLMFGALYLGWKGLVKRSSTEAGTAAIWMFGATVAGFAILANPMFIPSVVNTVVSTVSETTISAITSVAQSDKTTSGATSSSADLCTVSGSNGKNQTSDISGKVIVTDFTPSQNAARTSIRQIQCTMWYSFMYTPWVIGQFGVSPSATDTGVLTSGYPNKTGDIAPLVPVPNTISLGNGSTPGNWALYQLDNKVNYPDSKKVDQEKAMLNVAASQLYKSDANGTWKGNSSMNRVTTATLAMISALGAGAMIAVISMSMIVLQIGLVILTLLSALFLLVGVHPGFGRRIALGWLETMAGLAMKRIVLSVLLSVMLVFYSAVLSASASTDWLISMIMVIAVSLGGITYKDQLMSMFSRISFGGNGGLSEQDLGGRVASKAARGAAGGALGAATMGVAGIAGGAGARKHNKAVRESVMAKPADEDASAGAGDRPKSDGPETDGSADESAGAGERPTNNASPEADETPVSDNAGAGERPTSPSTAGEAPATENIGGAGERPAAAEAPAPEPVTFRRMSEAETQMLADQKKARIKKALKEAPMVKTRKVVMESMIQAARNHRRSPIGAYKAGSSIAKRHAQSATATYEARLKQEEQQRQAEEKAKRAKEAADAKAKRDAAKKLKDEANAANAERIKTQAADAKARRDAENKPGNGKHRGLPPLN